MEIPAVLHAGKMFFKSNCYNMVQLYLCIKKSKGFSMLKYLFLCFSFFAPVKMSTLRSFKLFQLYNNQIVAMVPPPGGHVSRQPLKKIQTPGCSLNIISVNHPDGSREERQTLTCTKVTVTKDGKKVKEKLGSLDLARKFFQNY